MAYFLFLGSFNYQNFVAPCIRNSDYNLCQTYYSWWFDRFTSSNFLPYTCKFCQREIDVNRDIEGDREKDNYFPKISSNGNKKNLNLQYFFNQYVSYALESTKVQNLFFLLLAIFLLKDLDSSSWKTLASDHWINIEIWEIYCLII